MVKRRKRLYITLDKNLINHLKIRKLKTGIPVSRQLEKAFLKRKNTVDIDFLKRKRRLK